MLRPHASWCVTLLALSACTAVGSARARWPEPSPVATARSDDASLADRDWITRQPICVGTRSWSAGALGNTVLFRSRRVGKTIHVGYFVYWSTERPWGANVASFTLLPALATDAFYSHFLYVFPGAKDALYGPGDIEGVDVEFEELGDGSVRVMGGRADNEDHTPVQLSRDDLLDSRGRLVVLTEVWSHQLGAHGAARFADTQGNDLRCYEKASLHPMTREVAQAFRLGDERKPLRAKPAWDAAPALAKASPR